MSAREVSRLRRALLAAAASPLAGCMPAAREIAGGFVGTDPARAHRLREPQLAVRPIRRRAQVLIAGGGMAGFAAARALRLRGIQDFALLELEDTAGGNSRAGELGGLPCPWGAHYLPVPGESARDLREWLEEIGLYRRVAGRWTWDERHLCHSPQERLFFRGEWQSGLLPVADVPSSTFAQYRRFAALVAEAGQEARFALPTVSGPLAASHRELDALRFDEWLVRQGLDDPHLRWYLDYCCRDDYGAGTGVVSAWAGLHYFASRHGFQPPGEGSAGDPVLTWPEGNAWLARRLAQPLGERLLPHRIVTRIEAGRHGVELDALNLPSGTWERWQARHVIVAVPAFVAARIVQGAPDFVHQAARGAAYAPWVVANLHLREPLADRRGAAPAWDNVIHGSPALGYVDATHQKLDPRPGPTVLTWYCAPGQAARGELLSLPWTGWRDRALADLGRAHPDLQDKLTQVAVARYGHAVAIPVPGTRARLAGLALRAKRMSFAHADWAGYSVLEEAFAFGHAAGLQA